jgi:hypothetical protein
MRSEIVRQIFGKFCNIKFYGNPLWNLELLHTYRKIDRRTDTAVYIGALRTSLRLHWNYSFVDGLNKDTFMFNKVLIAVAWQKACQEWPNSYKRQENC